MRIFVFTSLLLLAAAAVAGSQTPGLELGGVIQDPGGLPVAGARVELQPGNRVIQSGFDGTFRFSTLSPGKYQLSAGGEGFEKSERAVELQRTTLDLRIILKLAAQSAAITVTDTVEGLALDPAENKDAVEFDRELMDALPSFAGDTLAVATELLDPAALGSSGATLVVDGVETTRLGVTASAIAEMRVNRSPFSAEYSRPGSARIEVITKSGSQEFHGDANVYLRDYRFDARNAFAPTRPVQSRRTFEGDLSGPIGRSGKNTFVFSAEYETDNEQNIVYAQKPGGLVQETFRSPVRERELNLSLRRYHSDRHVFGFRIGTDWESADGLGVGGVALPETAYSSKATQHRMRFDHRWFPRSNLFTEFRLEADVEKADVRPAVDGTPRIVVRDAFVGGSAQQWSSERERDGELTFTMSWQKQRHAIRGGFLLPRIDWTAFEARDNFGGTFTFASLADYAARRPLSYTQSAGNPRIRLNTYTWALFIQDDWQVRPNLTIGLGLRYDRQNMLSDANNWAPRVSVALGLGPSRKSVLRAGAGIFYDRLHSSAYRDSLLLDGNRLRDYLLLNPAFPLVPDLSGTQIPISLFRLAGGLRSPYMIHTSVSFEHQFSQSVSAAITYNRIRGVSLFRTLDANAPIGPDWQRPLPGIAAIRHFESSGSSISNWINFQVQVRRGKFFRGTGQYSYGSAWDLAGGERELPPNSRDLSREWARSDYNRRHRFRLLGAFQLPAGFVLGTIASYRSGAPYEWTLGRDLNRDGSATERPAGVGRNALLGPSWFTVDLRLARKFSLGGDGSNSALTLSLDAFNALNNVNFSRIVGNESSPFFGQAVAARSARRLQLSARFSF